MVSISKSKLKIIVWHHLTLFSRGRKLTEPMKTLVLAPTQTNKSLTSRTWKTRIQIHSRPRSIDSAPLLLDPVFINSLLILKTLAPEHISNHLNFKDIQSQLTPKEPYTDPRLMVKSQSFPSPYPLEFQHANWHPLPTPTSVKTRLALLCITQTRMLTNKLHPNTTS